MRKSPYAEEHHEYDYNESFLNQNVNLSKFMFLPEGWEPLTLFFYVGMIPYTAGLLVIYFFIAEGDFDRFLLLDLFTIVPVWSIGYETLAALLMLKIISSAVDFQIRKREYLAKKWQDAPERFDKAVSDDLIGNYRQDY